MSRGDAVPAIRQHPAGPVGFFSRRQSERQSDALADARSRLSTDPEMTAEMARRARAMLNAKFTRQRPFERWEDVLDRIE